MKRIFIAAVAAATFTVSAFAADVSVSVSVGQPGFYGQIDIGGFPQPPLIYLQPKIVERVVVSRPPVYMRVPPGHARNWKKHCREYNACGERVYFVQDSWYSREYVPRYQKEHGDKHGSKNGNKKDDRKGNERGQGRDR